MEKVIKFVVKPVAYAAFYYVYWTGCYKFGEALGTYWWEIRNGACKKGDGGGGKFCPCCHRAS